MAVERNIVIQNGILKSLPAVFGKVSTFVMIILLINGRHRGCREQYEFAFRFYDRISRTVIV
jgi:hypothetical protein